MNLNHWGNGVWADGSWVPSSWGTATPATTITHSGQIAVPSKFIPKRKLPQFNPIEARMKDDDDILTTLLLLM